MQRLIDRLKDLKQSDEYPLHMPGHKRNMAGFDLEDAYDVDITEIEGYDNLYAAEGILKEVRERAREVFHADQTWLLVNGSTAGILTAISAVTHFKDTVIVARNCHKSVYHAMELRQLTPVYVYPQWIDSCNFAGEVTAEEIQRAIREHPQARAVILTSPTYEGIVSDIRKIAEIAHENQMILLVDEAHGAHFSFHPEFPQSAIRLGADLVIQSIHKTLPAFTQTALLHLSGNLVSQERIDHYLSVYQTSSPSYLLMSGIDTCIGLIQEKGSALWNPFLKELKEFAEVEKKLQRIQIISPYTKEMPVQMDPCKLVISVKNTSITGKELQKKLLKSDHIQVEMAAPDYVLGILTMCDTKEGFERLKKALLRIDREICTKASEIESPSYISNKTEVIFSPWEMENQSVEEIELSSAEDKIAGCYINLYPPGIPILVPGERITKRVLEIIQTITDQKLPIQGIVADQITVMK